MIRKGKINGSFTANGQESNKSETFGHKPIVLLRGTFVGTIALMISEDGGKNFFEHKTYTTARSEVIQSGSPGWIFQFWVTAWTSGECFYGLG